MKHATHITIAALLGGGLTHGVALRSWLPSRCPPPGEADKARLASFVRKKYKLSPDAEIGVADSGVKAGSCFPRLVFATLSGPNFRTELLASPDFRFLTNELLDARPDPKAEAETRRETAEALSRGNPPKRGSDDAPVTLAVFSDFQCPYCALVAKTLDAVAVSRTNELRVVYHYYPLSFHKWATHAAEAAACAQRQSNNAFWKLHDFIFAHQKELSDDNLQKHIADWARNAPSIDSEQFQGCVAKSLTSGQIEQDVALGNELGVHATPAIFLNGKPIDPSSAEELSALVRRESRN